jgi:hypothetical protein
MLYDRIQKRLAIARLANHDTDLVAFQQQANAGAH